MKKPRDYFKDFLNGESKKASVSYEKSKLSWNYRDIKNEEAEKLPRYLESPFLDQVASEPVILTSRELNTIKEHIKLLDAKVLKLRKSNRLLKILCLMLLLLLVAVVIMNHVGGVPFES
jgi:hypothetical protein